MYLSLKTGTELEGQSKGNTFSVGSTGLSFPENLPERADNECPFSRRRRCQTDLTEWQRRGLIWGVAISGG